MKLFFLQLPPEAADQKALGMLGAAQLERYRTIRRPVRARQHLWSRVLLNAFAQAAGAPAPGELPRNSAHPPAAGWRTSLAHAGDAVLLGASRSAVAVDLEPIRLRDWRSASAFAFEPDEAAAIAASDDPLDAFYAAWVERECRIKWPQGVPQAGARMTLVRTAGFMIGALGEENAELIENDALLRALPALERLLGGAGPCGAARTSFSNKD